MFKQFLLADPRAVFRMGLRAMLIECGDIPTIYEAINERDVRALLDSQMVDLVLINQKLVSDIAILPRGKFIVLTDELDMEVLEQAYNHGARGYLSENLSTEFFQILCRTYEETFLLDPLFVPRVLSELINKRDTFTTEKLMTAREREVINLIREGLNRREIADKLCIAPSTLKTHLKHIYKKINE